MEKSTIVAMATAVILAFTSQFATAGAIEDTYTAGDTLTTTTLDNIKSAVNDNNTASRFYGDGSAGSLTVSADVNWTSTPLIGAPPTGDNLNFIDLVINAGNTLTVPAGTVIRCTKTFTNNGTLRVQGQFNGGRRLNKLISFPSIIVPGRGDAGKVAGMPEGNTTVGVFLGGGTGGLGIPTTVAASSFNNFTRGGGGGSGGAGGPGGGLVKIYCQDAIINNGVIEANGLGGPTGGGGGGGGIVILASPTSVINNAGSIIHANGGVGANSSISNGASGGGGGGIIVMVAPKIANLGTTSVTRGAGGTGDKLITSSPHSAGGGGGASGGLGGGGGSIGSNNVASPGGAGADGYVLEITANPAHMM